jgi:branched-chain amino acid transport system permease protein
VTRTQRRVAGCALLVIGLGVLPLFASSGSILLQQMEYVYSLVLVAVGLNIVMGFAGQLSLGPGALFAVGGYTAAVLANHWPNQVGLLPMCAAAIVAAMVLGFLLGLPAGRVGGFYLGMVTLFFALVIPIVVGNMTITGGASGISLLANIDFVQHPSGPALYLLTAAIVLLAALMSWALLTSRIGHRFVVLRTSEELASSLGMSGYHTKLLAFVLSSIPAGLGGALYVYTQQFISPGSVTTTLSVYLLAACVIGGFGTVLGPVVGGILLLSLNQFLGSFSEYQGIIFGVLLVLFSVHLPSGLLGLGGNSPGFMPALRNALPPGLATLLKCPTGPEAQMGPPKNAAVPDSGLALGPHMPESASSNHLPLSVPYLSGPTQESLSLRGVRKSFGGVVALGGVDLDVAPSSIHGLIGSNGSGKTTLLNLVSGFYKADGGDIRIGDTRFMGTAGQAARIGVARTFQTPKLVPKLSVLANVVPAAEMTHRAGGWSSFLRLPAGRHADHEARLLAQDCLELLGIAEYADEPAGELPHGLRRLVELARALALRPRFLLLDEPGAGLSHFEVDRLRAILIAIREAGAGVLLVEHNVPLVLELADRVTALHLGRCLAEGPPSVIRSHPDVALAFLGESAESLRLEAPPVAADPGRMSE